MSTTDARYVASKIRGILDHGKRSRYAVASPFDNTDFSIRAVSSWRVEVSWVDGPSAETVRNSVGHLANAQQSWSNTPGVRMPKNPVTLALTRHYTPEMLADVGWASESTAAERADVAAHSATPVHGLAKLALDEDLLVQKSALENHHTPAAAVRQGAMGLPARVINRRLCRIVTSELPRSVSEVAGVLLEECSDDSVLVRDLVDAAYACADTPTPQAPEFTELFDMASAEAAQRSLEARVDYPRGTFAELRDRLRPGTHLRMDAGSFDGELIGVTCVVKKATSKGLTCQIEDALPGASELNKLVLQWPVLMSQVTYFTGPVESFELTHKTSWWRYVIEPSSKI